ncbi:MAG TPA: cytochrome P450 [Candidatus Binatia bacterium]|jgi:cytochrome P450
MATAVPHAPGPPRPTPPAAIPRASAFDTLAQMIGFRNKTLHLVRRLRERYGPVVFQNTLLVPLVSLFGPEANRFVLLDQEQQLSAKRAWDLVMGRIFTNGLLLRDGLDHRHHRRIMQVAFHQSALRDYVERMNPHIATVIEEWATAPGSLRAFDAFKALTLDLACRIFLGVELGAEATRLNQAFEATVAASMSLVRLRIPGLEFDRGLRGREFMIDFFGAMMPRKRSGADADMFSRLCRAESEEHERYSDQEILDHLIFLMMAAHDTTTSTLTSMTYELACHPEWQERVRAECRSYEAEMLGFEDLGKLESLGLVLNETLRRHPPLSTIPRTSTRAFAFDGFEVPADTMVAIYPLQTHYMEEYWTRPFDFDPMRFAPGRAEHEQHPYLFIPFGGGAHMCIGYRFAEAQIKAAMYQLVRRYRWSVATGYVMPEQQAPIAKPRDGLPVSFERVA